MHQADLLDPVDIPSRLDQLDLYLGQVCAVAGISKMQLDYWTTKAGIETNGRKQRTYDMRSVELVMLIKQAKDKGMTLPAAIEAAREFQARRSARLAETPYHRGRRRQGLVPWVRSSSAARSGLTMLIHTPAPSSADAAIVSRGHTSACQCQRSMPSGAA